MNRYVVEIPPVNLSADLCIPSGSKGIIIFVHGSGSNRFSIRNKYVANYFNQNKISTLLIDLLTSEEKERDQIKEHIRFNIEFLTQRLVLITNWVKNNALTKHLSIGYFSSSTGTAAAFKASILFNDIQAIVSRSGRIDMLEPSIINKVTVPVLLIIGEKDPFLVSLTKRMYKQLLNQKDVSIIPKANHFFEEKGKMEDLSYLAFQWFNYYLLKCHGEFVNIYKENSNFFSKFNFKIRFQIKFDDRLSAGIILSNILKKYTRNTKNISFVGILTGGTILTNIITSRLSIDNFNVVLTKRLRNPYNYENTIGTIFQDGSVYLNPISKNFSNEYINMELENKRHELETQISLYNINDEKYNFNGKTVILVDDGCYSGSTLIAVGKWLKSAHPSKIIVALPVISKQIYPKLLQYFDIIEFVFMPKNLKSVEMYYQNFDSILPLDILDILKRRGNRVCDKKNLIN